MLAYLLVGLIGACAAAPRLPIGPPPFYPPPDSRTGIGHQHFEPIMDEFFDTKHFWAQLANDMRQLDTMLADFYQKFPVISSQAGIQGDEYKVTIPLSGFQEKDIIVKAREGLLMVQAVHKMEDGGERSYLDIKTLPASVNVSGQWTFEDGVLKIVFPLKEDVLQNRAGPVTQEPVTAEAESHSREEMDTRGQSTAEFVDADVGLQGKQHELDTNEISKNTVEATTYAVDFKDEVEFVPVRY